MATILTKPISRELNTKVRDAGKIRSLEVTLEPNGIMTLRPKGTRKDGPAVVYINLGTAYTEWLYRRYAREK